MLKTDPYHVLGINRSATDDEIKKAYRQMAKKYHPDRNSNDKNAEAKFKEISEAYEILSSKERRHNYDRYGHEGPSNFGFNNGGFTRENPFGNRGGFNFNFGQGGQGFGAFEDVFTEFFNTDRRSSRRSARKGSNLEYNLNIEFEQAYSGVSIDVKVMDRRITVHVPAGVDTGSTVRVSGQGASGLRGGEPGDLLIKIVLNPHKVFRREAQNIYLELPITLGEAILGAKIEVPAPEGRLLLKIPPGTQSGTNFRFKGKGFSSLKKEPRGDFFIITHIVIPDNIDSLSKELIEQFDSRNPLNLRRNL